MKISDLIGEATEYDKKETLEERRPKSWLKSVSAFANGIGGALIFGVTDNEEPVGLSDSKDVSEKISEIIKTKMDPIPQVIMEIHEEAGNEFVILRVPSGIETPYYYIGEGNRTAFIRVGNQSIPAGTIDLKHLVLHGSNKTYDSLTSQYKYENFAFTKLRSVYRKRAGQELEESDFTSFGLTDVNGMLTNAGALLADDSPVRHSRLFCTRWYGLDKASGVMEAIDDKEFSGSLVTLLQSGEEFVKNNSKKRWKKTANGRLEMPDYPERAILECIVNALIHRDYLDLGSEVHIDMYDDRLEIYSPGGMYDGSQVQNLDTDRVPSRRRNPIIADIFNRMNYMERRGSGFKKIKGDYRKEVNYKEALEPKFYSDNSSFWVTLYNLNYNVPVEKVDFGDEKVDFHSKKVDFEGQKVNIEFIETALTEMKVNLPTKEKAKEVFLSFGIQTVFSRKEVAKLLEISPTSASNLLAKMDKAGLLETVVGQGKGKYRFR
ncbi:putative HTH transcriptional regulator [Lachnotalea glycerini]|uniref:Putative HTH transcriptional regulator n=1 Tax=Lachnotalea glycerini TaxID=1763509 RepID=A0A318EWX4_9FIRM|nr:ATP-binding protein [Lachnotalea glycerini]PXV91164.1 putative HTH transcriptional regulator [Lachnotalea glycerini]